MVGAHSCREIGRGFFRSAVRTHPCQRRAAGLGRSCKREMSERLWGSGARPLMLARLRWRAPAQIASPRPAAPACIPAQATPCQASPQNLAQEQRGRIPDAGSVTGVHIRSRRGAAARAQPPAAAQARPPPAAAPCLRRRRALTAPVSIVTLFRATYSPGAQCAGPCPGRNSAAADLGFAPARPGRPGPPRQPRSSSWSRARARTMARATGRPAAPSQ